MMGCIRVQQRKKTVWFGLKRRIFGALGSGVRFGGTSSFFRSENIFVGGHVFFGAECYFEAVSEIHIGSGCMFGPRVFCVAGSHNYDSPDLRAVPFDDRQVDLPVVIGDNVWIGGNVTIAPGARIGEGSVVGSGAIVAGEIPPFSVVLGEKGQVVKSRDCSRYQRLVAEGAVFGRKYAGMPFEMLSREDDRLS